MADAFALAAPVPHGATVAAGVRGFGEAADLALEFGRPDRPAIVTELLARCAAPHDAGHWWAQPVGARTAALMRVAAASDGARAWPLSSRCSGCGETFEFELPLQALVDSAPAPARVLELPLADRPAWRARRPTGRDLQHWRAAAWASRRDAVAAMLDALTVEGPSPDVEDEPALAAALSALDPLVACEVGCACPACALPQSVPVDLEAMALQRLAACQRAVLLDVHRLATHYGWSEAEVLAVPAPRRRRYLALIEAGA